MRRLLCIMMILLLVLCVSNNASAVYDPWYGWSENRPPDTEQGEELESEEPAQDNSDSDDSELEEVLDPGDLAVTEDPEEVDLQQVIEDTVHSVLEGLEDDDTSGDSDPGIMVTADISSQYGLGTSNISIFGPIASKLGYGVHYVYYREGQYKYCLAYSPSLSLNGTNFTGENVTVVTYSTSTSTYSQATFTVTEEANFTLSAGSFLVWSDLGNYPTLYDRGTEDYAKTACVILASFGLYYLFKCLWASIRQRFLND